MNGERTWIRYVGRVWENLDFEPETGWETDVIARRPAVGDGTWTLELLDARGRVLLEQSPHVSFSPAPGAQPGRMQSARIVAYVPVHPDGRLLRLRRRDYVVDEREVAEQRPEVDQVHVVLRQGMAQVAWDALHPDPGALPLSFRVVYLAPGRGAFPIARDLHQTALDIPISRLPGSPAGRFAVLATDGLRSGHAVSEPVPIPAKPARVSILQPYPGQDVPYGQPVTLRGTAHDDAGRRLDSGGLVWTLNGQPLTREQHLGMMRDLEPGQHALVLAWEGAGAPRAETRVLFRVGQPTRPPELEPMTRAPQERPQPQPGQPLRIKL